VPSECVSTLEGLALCFDIPKSRITRMNSMTGSVILSSSILVPLNLSAKSSGLDTKWVEVKKCLISEFMQRTACTDRVEAELYVKTLWNNDIEAAIKDYQEAVAWAKSNPRIIQTCEKESAELTPRSRCFCCRPKAEGKAPLTETNRNPGIELQAVSVH